MALAGLLAFTSGCYTPKHSNVLMFGTNTKYAFDVSYDSKMQQPNITLGYTRQEGVWMPLLANRGEEGLQPAPGKKNSAGEEGDDLYRGNDGTDFDTYSVLATFGAKFSAGGSGTNGATVSSGLSQYFATGLAARELVKKGGADLVAARPPMSESQATSEYIVSKNHQQDATNFRNLISKKLTSAQAANGKQFAVGDSAKDYADALAAEKGDTLPNIVNQPRHGAALQDILNKLQEATK